MATPSSPRDAVNISSKLRRNSLVSDPEDMNLLREKLTRIAVGRHPLPSSTTETRPMQHFQVFPLPPERPSTPPSSPQPRDVLRKQLRLKQQARRRSIGSLEDEDELDALVSVDDVEITPMDMEEEDSNAVHSPPARGRRSPQARLSIPGHLRVRSPFSVLNKYPEGLRKRKSVHVADAEPEERGSLKKTSSQINILASSAARLPRSNSATGEMFQAFAVQRIDQDQDMEDCASRPQSPRAPLFSGAIKNKHGRLSACS